MDVTCSVQGHFLVLTSGLHLTSLCVLFLAVKRKKRKMGMYNLVPKKKVKALKQQEKAGLFICLFLCVRPPLSPLLVTLKSNCMVTMCNHHV